MISLKVRVIFLMLNIVLLATVAEAKNYKHEDTFSKKERQVIRILVANNHFEKASVSQAALASPSVFATYLNQLDPYSKYFTAKEVAFKHKRENKKRLGIGLDLLLNGKKILGVPIKGGPAYQAGIKTPAYICTIDQRKIDASKFESYQFLANFSAGQNVEVQTASKKGKKLKPYQVQVKSFTQSHVSIEHLDAYDVLSIRQFSNDSTARIKQYLKSLSPKKPLVVDLRFNPGGDLYATTDTLSFFLKENMTVAYLKERSSRAPLALKTVSGKIISNKKIYLLLSQFTASSAEIFAQAIKHYLPQTVFVGGATTGKCLAQETYSLDNKSALQLSVYEVLNAQKSRCQNKPLIADIKIKNIEIMPLTQVINSLGRLN